jgi:predicted ATPase
MAKAMQIDLTTLRRHPRRRRISIKRSSMMRRRPRRIIRGGRNVGPTVDAIRLINFKAFEDTGWIPFKGVTYLMGANSAGKSSILNAIKFISSVVSKDIAPFEKEESFLSEFPLSDTKRGLNLGTINDTIFDGKQSFTIQLRVFNKKFSTYITYSFKFGKPKHRDVKQITNAALLSLEILTKWGKLVEWTPDKNKVKLYQSTLKDSGYKRDALKEQIYHDASRTKNSFLRALKPSGKDRSIVKTSDEIKEIISDLYKGADADFLLNFIEFTLPNLFKLSGDFISDIEKKEGSEEEFDIITETMEAHGGWLEDIKDRLLADYGENYFIDFIDEPLDCLSLINKTFKKTKHARAKSDPKKIPGFRQFIKWSGIFYHDVYKSPKYIFEKIDNLKKLILIFDTGNQDDKNRAIELINEAAENFLDVFMENYTPDIFLSELIGEASVEINYFARSILNVPPLRAVAERTVGINDTNSAADVYKQIAMSDNRDKKLKFISKHFLQKLGVTNLKVKRSDISDNLLVPVMQDSNKSRNLADFGFGFSQVVPILWKCLADKSKTGLTIIEQPEIHLHPGAQAILAEYLFSLRKHGYYKPLFVETHSEHMVLKTQVLTKHEPKNHKDFQIVFISRKPISKNKKSSIVQIIDFDDEGQLSEPFPDDFFDLSYRLASELF